jgi:hypothetical protein
MHCALLCLDTHRRRWCPALDQEEGEAEAAELPNPLQGPLPGGLKAELTPPAALDQASGRKMLVCMHVCIHACMHVCMYACSVSQNLALDRAHAWQYLL